MQYNSDPVTVKNPKKIKAWQLHAERVMLGQGYKPSLAVMPDGELMMVSLVMGLKADGTGTEDTLLWRSKDGGKTWSDPELLEDVIGREQWLTCISDGTLFLTCHIIAHDVRNEANICHSYLHRSDDQGKTWKRTKILLTGGPEGDLPIETAVSRNIVEFSDGTLFWGVSARSSKSSYGWTSKDKGVTWISSPVSVPVNYDDEPYDPPLSGFFDEDFSYLTSSGKLLHWFRVGNECSMYPIHNDQRAVPAGNDQIHRSMLCESDDMGQTWSGLRDFGTYGMMYVKLLKLKDGRLLMTYTQRALEYPLGMRAIISYDDGETWDFEYDQITIEARTPWLKPSGGGFGNTVQLDTGKLVTCYSYRDHDNKLYIEVARWELP